METSDSEYFESADEDFQSDDEDTKTVSSVTKTEEKPNTKCVNDAIKKLEHVQLEDTQEKNSLNNNKKNDKGKTNKEIEDNINSNEITEDLAQIQATKGPGSKLNKVEASHPTSVKKRSKETDVPKKLGAKLSCKDSVAKPPQESPECVKNVDQKQPKESPECVKSADQKQPKSETSNIEENLWDESEIDWGKENEDDLWGNDDDWEPVNEPTVPPQREKIEPAQVKVPSSSSWGSWGTWDVSSIISTATQSVSTLTQGISTVLETGIGVPDPEELAKINQAEKEKLKEIVPDEDTDNSGFGLGNLVMGVSQLTKLVETTGTKVISGGLDTLETIGKKTMEVLQEGDPGLKKKRAFLKIDQDKPVLSQLLREAKEKAEEENKILEEKHFAKKAKNYETLFDDHQGLVHLEALEMLSKQCDIKLQTLLESYTDEALTEMQETMDQVKELCELPDEEEDEHANWTEIKEKLESAVSEISIPISYKKFVETWEETEAWLNNLKLEICDARELHQQAVETLAQLTAIAVEQFHKAGELLLVKEHRSTADEADSLVQLTTTLTSLIGVVAAKFSDKLNTKSSSSKNKEEINSLITNVFFEAANSSSYIQDAFQLLIPVLQVGAV
ncbi:protein FAM114A2 [Tribolium castaneum]|uniref:Protein FAM114A2-like Protein n=1 Tax=Tribolium castaneum TaxID=7070 RepID=D2A0T0_TRICA|nr:PREDICTED: protein FAM114A2 [Tribolium castaneum]EFA01640.1 Protein FAM114A2-like Protein [Tribolium castaneum]|eukprot:XP_971021.1 PREDICTED: protein FAM114A2 [Tribolium castaneum]